MRWLVRDLALDDCIMDLVDNAMDSLIRIESIDVSERILDSRARGKKLHGRIPVVHIRVSADSFEIIDNCGGISQDEAINETFILGHEKLPSGSRLGVYGIGLKRALFKIGDIIHIESRTQRDGFSVDLNLKEWATKKNKEGQEDWTIPIDLTEGTQSPANAGTCIRVEDLHDDVQTRIRGGVFVGELAEGIARTYSVFLDRYVRVKLNDKWIKPEPVPIGSSKEVIPAKERFVESSPEGSVTVTLTASLASPGESGQWKQDDAGWYVLCNGRVVLRANQDTLTGWGDGIASFHSGKFSKFVGIAYFYSERPDLLPWSTTKRGINRESEVYQKARARMVKTAKPIVSFLNRMYPTEMIQEPVERDIADKVKRADIGKFVRGADTAFTVKPAKKSLRTTTRIQYHAKVRDVEKIKKHLRNMSLTNSKIGLATFEHYLKTECLK